MKKIHIILGIVVALVVLFVGILVASVIITNSADNGYNSSNLNKTVPKVKAVDVLDSKTPTVYYFYQETCHYCNSVKGEVSKFANVTLNTENIDFKMVDMADDINRDSWKEENEDFNYKTVKSGADIKVAGTPAMAYVVDGKIKDYQEGIAIFDLMKKVIDEYNLGISLNSSVYGKS